MLAGTAAVSLTHCDSPADNTKKQHNIIFILADDLGYMDVSAFAAGMTDAKPSEMFYEPPEIDKMIANRTRVSECR